jgi:hypothetical protein
MLDYKVNSHSFRFRNFCSTHGVGYLYDKEIPSSFYGSPSGERRKAVFLRGIQVKVSTPIPAFQCLQACVFKCMLSYTSPRISKPSHLR